MELQTAVLSTVTICNVLSAAVPETSTMYSCLEGSHDLNSANASTDIDCDQVWATTEKTIATFQNGKPECHMPCTQVNAGQITITSCVNITLTVVCSNGYLTEYRIHFLGTTIAHLPKQDKMMRSRYGIFASVFLLLILLALEICHSCTRNTALNNC